MSSSSSDPALRPRELERAVMEAVWTLEQATPRQVLEQLNAATGRDRAYTTVATTLLRLERKGDVVKHRHGRADVYRATCGRQEWLNERAGSAVEDLVENYGDVVLAHFAQQVSALDPERLAALKRLADER